MERQLVPELLAQRRERKPLLKIWSAASSNGAEAYSIAMILADLAEARGDFGFAILGTDISTAMLRHGAAGDLPGGGGRAGAAGDAGALPDERRPPAPPGPGPDRAGAPKTRALSAP